MSERKDELVEKILEEVKKELDRADAEKNGEDA